MKTFINLKGFKISSKCWFKLTALSVEGCSTIFSENVNNCYFLSPAYLEDEFEPPLFEIINVTIKHDGKFHLCEIET